MEFELTVTIARHGHDLDNGEKLSHGFAITHPDVGAIVEQNLETGTMTATFWYEADDFPSAAERGAAIFTESANAAGLARTEFIAAHVSAVDHAGDPAEARQLQPA